MATELLVDLQVGHLIRPYAMWQ